MILYELISYAYYSVIAMVDSCISSRISTWSVWV